MPELVNPLGGVIEFRVDGEIAGYQCPACCVSWSVLDGRENGHRVCAARLEAKVDALTAALKAGAIGRWQP